MANGNRAAARPDIDIHNDILDLIVHYPPLNADRHHIHVEVSDGAVVVHGHTRTPITRQYLLDALKHVDGVQRVNADRFYDEESLRLEAGRAIPRGVLVNNRYGTLILSGRLPAGISIDQVLEAVSRIPGVERVVTEFLP
jgi:osmotically-inducible protein OsmY